MRRTRTSRARRRGEARVASSPAASDESIAAPQVWSCSPRGARTSRPGRRPASRRPPPPRKRAELEGVDRRTNLSSSPTLLEPVSRANSRIVSSIENRASRRRSSSDSLQGGYRVDERERCPPASQALPSAAGDPPGPPREVLLPPKKKGQAGNGRRAHLVHRAGSVASRGRRIAWRSVVCRARGTGPRSSCARKLERCSSRCKKAQPAADTCVHAAASYDLRAVARRGAPQTRRRRNRRRLLRQRGGNRVEAHGRRSTKSITASDAARGGTGKLPLGRDSQGLAARH
jgi:hypothetical protein